MNQEIAGAGENFWSTNQKFEQSPEVLSFELKSWLGSSELASCEEEGGEVGGDSGGIFFISALALHSARAEGCLKGFNQGYEHIDNLEKLRKKIM